MRRPKSRVVLAVIGAAALAQLLAVLVYLAVEKGKEPPVRRIFKAEPLVASPAPDIELVRPGGATFRLSELRGRPVLVHFWATWCKPCVEELPELLAFARGQERRAGRLELVAVAADETWEAVRDFFKGEIPAEVVRGARGDEPKRFGVSTFPDSYLVRASGELTVRFPGAQAWGSGEAGAFWRTAQAPWPPSSP